MPHSEHPSLMAYPVTARMAARVAAWEEEGDRRRFFLACYATMTGNMLAALPEGRFHDDAWVDALLHHFADYYFDALDAYEHQAAPPAIWQHAHDAACAAEGFVVQHLFLGINAHINYDLVLALCDLLDPEWDALTEAGRRRRYEDHCRVNQIIAETVDRVQDQVVEPEVPMLDWLDRLAGPLDEWMASRMIAGWREDVWARAVRMVEAPPPARESLRQAVEAAALRRARWLCPSHF